MAYQIKNYDLSYIKKQVELIWEVTGSWTHEYQTSIESVTNAYSSENFDPSTRFYAFEGEDLVGYVTSALVDDKDKGKTGTLRFPIVKNNDMEITTALYEKAESRLKELGAKRIKSFAGEGMGNTVELAEKFGFNSSPSNFKRSKAKISELNLNRDTGNVQDYTDLHTEQLRELFMTKLYPGGIGEGILQRMLANKARKDTIGPNRTSWKLVIDDKGILGFSSIHMSDHNQNQGNMPPIYFRDVSNGFQVMDKLLSSHISKLQGHGLTDISTFISKEIFATEPLYNKLGFNFDSFSSFEKTLE